MLPRILAKSLGLHPESVRALHDRDVAEGYGRARGPLDALPGSIDCEEDYPS